MKTKFETYTLFAHWASYLINGDASGAVRDEIEQIDNFLAQHHLGSAVSCSDESWFARSNDASELGGDVLDFVFPIRS